MIQSAAAVPAVSPHDPWLDPAATRLVGDPVDVVTGHLVERTPCIRLIGPITLAFDRLYDSGRTSISCGLGHGHAHSYDARLSFDIDGLMLEEASGTRVAFPALIANGASETKRGRTLHRQTLRAYTLTKLGEPGLHFEFTNPHCAARIARVAQGKFSIGFTYDRDGRLVGITHSTGLPIVVEEDATGRLLSLRGPLAGDAEQPILTCKYDEAGDCRSIVDARGRRSAYRYDAAHRLVRRTDRRGYSILFAYDGLGRCISAGGEDGLRGVRLRYIPDRRVTYVEKSDGGVWQYHYDEDGIIRTVIDPDRHETRYIKAENGRIIGEVDAVGARLDYVFGPGGGLTGKRFGTGRVIPVRNGEEVSDPPAHRLAACAREYMFGDLPEDLEETAAPNDVPPLLWRALPRWLPPVPDTPHVPPFGPEPWYPAPSGGRHYSPFGHLERQDLPGGGVRRWSYDERDSMQTYTDGDGAVTKQGRRCWDLLAAVVDPLGQLSRYQYNHETLPTEFADPGGTLTEFAYDHRFRLASVRRGEALKETYRRDGVGNLIEKRDAAGGALLFRKPTEDRLVAERALASGGTHKFEYDSLGRVTRADADGVEVTRDYDAHGRIVRELRDNAGVVHTPNATIVFGRIVIGREETECGVTLRLPAGGLVRITRLAQGAMRREFGCGTTELSQFDIMGRCTASVAALSRELGTWTRHWAYSFEGDLSAAHDSRHRATRYQYDAAHRLVHAIPDRGTAASFEHDAAGNLVAQPGLAGVSLGPANRLATANGESFTYDHRQNMVRRAGPGGNTTYHFDSRGLLICAESGETSWQATYDALGRRVRCWQGDAETTFWWDNDRLAAERGPDGTLRIYVYAEFWALTPCAFLDLASAEAAAETARIRYVLSDQRGAPVLVQDSSGTVLWEAVLAPYGEARLLTAAGLTLNLRFPGHYFDAATGLHNNGYRSYDPRLGRYLQSDPIGLGGGPNMYAYPVNPLVVVDVRGLAGGVCPRRQATSGDADAEQTGQPSESGNLPSRDEALAQAKADAGIPPDAEPIEVRIVALTDRNGTPILDGNNQMIPTREEGYLVAGAPDADGNPTVNLVVVQDHHTGHQFGEGGAGDQGPHFNVRPGDNTRNGSVPGTQEHYPYDPNTAQAPGWDG